MNYEEKYKEALERAKKVKHDIENIGCSMAPDMLEVIFPELAESEDERIRKAIIHYILYETKGTISEATEHTWVKWLEKQKEKAVDKEGMYYYLGGKFIYCGYPATEENPYDFAMSQQEKQKENPKSADSIPSDCVSDAKCEDRWHKVGDSLPDNGRLVLAKDCLGNVLLARYDGENWEVNVYDNEDHYCHNSISKWCEIPSEKQKEQKPNIELIQRAWYMEGYHDREFGKEPKWIIKTGEGGPKHELNPRYGQPLTGQQVTEEQLHNLNEAIKSFRMDGFDKIADSLHSLYNILNTQEQKPADLSDMMVHKEPYIAPVPTPMVADEQKSEWSEKDEKMKERLITRLNWITYNTRTDGTSPNITFFDEIEWLKSLRPSWKPSEGQMKALQNAVALTACDKELVRLYNQLKKL